MIRNGVSSYSFCSYLCDGRMKLTDVIVKAAELGFDGIEMANITDEWLHLEFDLKELRETAEKCGIEICSWAMAADYANNTDAEIIRAKQQIDMAHILGARIVRTDVCDERTPDPYCEDVINALRELSDYCAGYDMELVTENHGGYFCRPDRLEKLCALVARSNFGLLCDFANYADAAVDPREAVAATRSLIRHVHMKDCHLLKGDRLYPGEGWYVTQCGDYWRCAITGHGNLPLTECVKSLRQIGYDGYLIQEFEGIEDCVFAVEQGLKYTKRLLETYKYGIWSEEC